jgi:SAM-dependent methyltransferase
VTDTAPGTRASAFYDEAYRRAGERHERWREIGAVGKADHVVDLLRRTGIAHGRIVEIGCGDGALLAELARRGMGRSLSGFDVSREAVEKARARTIPRIESIEAVDAERLPVPDGSFDLAVLSHVLPDPSAVLAEAVRVASAVIVEVPLERSLSGRRPSRRDLSARIGHLHALDRFAARRLVAAAGLRIEAELLDPLPAAVHLFQAETPRARAAAWVKAAVRRGVFWASPRLAARLFTVHYACAGLPVRRS